MKQGIYWEDRKIVGASGKEYKICPETMSSARYIEFEIRSMTQAFKTNLDGIISMMNRVEDHLVNGKLNAQGNTHNALTELKTFRAGLVNHAEFKRTESIEFCALFCTYEGEDTSVYSEDMVAEKWRDWKGIPDEDFFLLSIRVKLLLSTRYANIVRSQNPDLNEDISN